MSEKDDFLLNRLNYDPVVFMGCSQKEIITVIGCISVPLLSVGSVFGYIAWDNVPFGILPGFILPAVLSLVALNVIRHTKRDKAPGYLEQMVTDKIEKAGLRKTQIIRRSGAWSGGRFK